MLRTTSITPIPPKSSGLLIRVKKRLACAERIKIRADFQKSEILREFFSVVWTIGSGFEPVFRG